jgi:hypothetical protein
MSVQAVAVSAEQSELKTSWVPMIAIALGQMIMSFNVASLPSKLRRRCVSILRRGCAR